jgi:hypothetical protein
LQSFFFIIIITATITIIIIISPLQSTVTLQSLARTNPH